MVYMAIRSILLDLDRRVVNAKVALQLISDLAQEGVAPAARRHNKMSCEGTFRRAHAPDVKVMYCLYAGEG